MAEGETYSRGAALWGQLNSSTTRKDRGMTDAREDHPEIRGAVRALCACFPDVHFREADQAGEYPAPSSVRWPRPVGSLRWSPRTMTAPGSA